MLSTILFSWNFFMQCYYVIYYAYWFIKFWFFTVMCLRKKNPFQSILIYKFQCNAQSIFLLQISCYWTDLLLLPDAWSSYEAGFDLLFWAVLIELLHCTTLLFTKHTNKSQLKDQACCGYRVNPCATAVCVCGWGWTLETMLHDAHSYCATMFHC